MSRNTASGGASNRIIRRWKRCYIRFCTLSAPKWNPKKKGENSSVIEIVGSNLAKRLRVHEEKWVVLRSNSRNDRTPRVL